MTPVFELMRIRKWGYGLRIIFFYPPIRNSLNFSLYFKASGGRGLEGIEGMFIFSDSYRKLKEFFRNRMRDVGSFRDVTRK